MAAKSRQKQGRKRSTELSPLADDLRQVARRGLEAENLLELDVLLGLPVVTRRAGQGARRLALAEAAIDVLRDTFAELTDPKRAAGPYVDSAALARRQELISALFRLEPRWKGKRISWRRAELAGPEGPRTFVRREENPLMELIATQLLEPGQPVPNGWEGLDPVWRSLRRLHSSLNVRLHAVSPPQTRATEPEHMLALYGQFLLAYEEMSTTDLEPEHWSPAPDGSSPVTRLRLIHDLAPLEERQRSLLRAEVRKADGEHGPFLDFLEDRPRGQALLRAWLDWLDCQCPTDPSWRPPPREDTGLFDIKCRLHWFLDQAEIFLTQRRGDLPIDWRRAWKQKQRGRAAQEEA